MRARPADANVIFLSHHGVIVTAPGIALAFDDLCFLEQMPGAATDRPLRIVPEETAALTAHRMAQESGQARPRFAELKRDRDEPGWRERA